MEASITLDFSSYSNNIIDVIKLFGKIGWSIYNTKGEVEYLPIGDADKYNWQWGKCPKLNFLRWYPIKSLIMNKWELICFTVMVRKEFRY